MTQIPQKIRKQIDEDPFYKNCALYRQHGHTCDGRITMDHTIIVAGKQLQSLWSIVPVCAAAHGVDGHLESPINKELRLWVALNRASTHDLIMISKAVNYVKERDRLIAKWGHYRQDVPDHMETGRKKDDYH